MSQTVSTSRGQYSRRPRRRAHRPLRRPPRATTAGTSRTTPRPGPTRSPIRCRRRKCDFPEDKTGAARSRVFVDQFGGNVLGVVNCRELLVGTRIINFVEPTHAGIVLGWPTTVIAFLGTAALAGQAVTRVS